MTKFGMFQIIGAAVTTMGLMFMIITLISQTGILEIPPISLETAIVSLLMAINGYLIMLLGVKGTVKKNVPA